MCGSYPADKYLPATPLVASDLCTLSNITIEGRNPTDFPPGRDPDDCDGWLVDISSFRASDHHLLK